MAHQLRVIGDMKRYPVEEMTHHQFTSRSIIRFAAFVGVFSCISLLDTGCSRRTSEDKHENTTVETALSSLILDGPELHESLRTRKMDSMRDLPTGIVSPGNPYLSADDEFVQAVARGGSQGRLGKDGIRTALFARYSTGENELGFYGLEAESETHADEREKALHEIWAHNGRHGRSRVHRKGLILLVVWHDDVSPECWESVNATVVERLNALLHNDG